jgi:16S rRNA (guanine527-N7)-methyltransferase
VNYFFTRQTLIGSLTDTLRGMLEMHVTMKGWMEEAGVSITEDQFTKLSKYLQLLKAKNSALNLTRITDNREAWIKHILDSLMAAPFFTKPGTKAADIGTGGGLPGIPLAILFPSAHFTLVDATEKKIAAVEEFATELNLKNVSCISGRVEALGHLTAHREQYDLVLARAVAPLRVLIELAVPLIHPYGNVIAYKGPEYISELALSQNAVQKLKCEAPRIYHYTLPEGMGHRTLLQITKKDPSPDVYPRRDGVPSKNPL